LSSTSKRVEPGLSKFIDLFRITYGVESNRCRLSFNPYGGRDIYEGSGRTVIAIYKIVYGAFTEMSLANHRQNPPKVL